MKTPLETLISEEEGLRFKVYDDATGQPIVPGYTVKGHPTIGYGRALDTHGISEDEAGLLLDSDILATKQGLAGEYPWFNSLNTERQAALVSMAYNLGMNGFGRFGLMISYLSQGDFDKAAQQIENSIWAHQVPERAFRLANVVRNGVL